MIKKSIALGEEKFPNLPNHTLPWLRFHDQPFPISRTMKHSDRPSSRLQQASTGRLPFLSRHTHLPTPTRSTPGPLSHAREAQFVPYTALPCPGKPRSMPDAQLADDPKFLAQMVLALSHLPPGRSDQEKCPCTCKLCAPACVCAHHACMYPTQAKQAHTHTHTLSLSLSLSLSFLSSNSLTPFIRGPTLASIYFDGFEFVLRRAQPGSPPLQNEFSAIFFLSTLDARAGAEDKRSMDFLTSTSQLQCRRDSLRVRLPHLLQEALFSRP
ncbi:hypothetical protein ACJBU6_04191 [Exserohilum turcicum]